MTEAGREPRRLITDDNINIALGVDTGLSRGHFFTKERLTE